jgi:hypothetical protein
MKLPIENIYKFLTAPRNLSIRVNIATLVLSFISIVSLGLLLSSYHTQRQLNYLVKQQSSTISEMIKTKEDEKSFSVALTQATGLNNELRDTITKLRVLPSSIASKGTEVNLVPTDNNNQGSVEGVQTNSTLPQIVGMVQVNGDPTEPKNIYNGFQSGSTIIGSAAGSDFLFYTQKQPGWYQVELRNGDIGWIPEEQITELAE